METIVALVAAESPTTDRDAANRCGDLISALVRQQGGEVELVRSERCGDHLVARFGGGSGDQLLLLGHFDTVWPLGQLDRKPLREEDGHSYVESEEVPEHHQDAVRRAEIGCPERAIVVDN